MTPDDALRAAASGQLSPVYVVVGEEAFIRDQVLHALRAAALAGGIPGMNDDALVAGKDAPPDAAVALARTLPMMASRRVVSVRQVEGWEPKNESSAKDDKREQQRARAFELLTEYLVEPSPSTVLLLSGAKVDKRRKWFLAAQKAGYVVQCDPLNKDALERWVEQRARQRGARLAQGVARHLVELAGPELGTVAEALERLALYAADGTIDEEALQACVVRVRPTQAWELLNATLGRDVEQVLLILSEAFDPSEGPKLVGLLASQLRKLLAFATARASGASVRDAAFAAGERYDAEKLERTLRASSVPEIEAFLASLARIDADVKGGSRRPSRAVFEAALLEPARRRGSSAR